MTSCHLRPHFHFLLGTLTATLLHGRNPEILLVRGSVRQLQFTVRLYVMCIEEKHNTLHKPLPKCEVHFQLSASKGNHQNGAVME